MNKKKLLHVVSDLGHGGTIRHISTLLSEQAKQGYDLTLVIYGQAPEQIYYSFPEKLKIIYLRTTDNQNDLTLIKALRATIQSHRPDIIISWIADINIRTCLATIGLKIPLIVKEGSHPIKQPLSKLSRLLRFLLYAKAYYLIVQTNEVCKLYPFWLQSKIKVIHNPVMQSLEALSLKNKTLISAGRLSEEKDFSKLIRAFHQALFNNPGWRLIIWGEGPERPHLEKLISDLALQNHAQLPGNSASANQWLSSGQVFTMCSQYEGFPNALAEAMAAGYPVVTTPFDFGPQTMIKSDVDGLIAEDLSVDALSKALSYTMKHESEASAWGRSARHKAQTEWSPEKIALQWHKLIESV